MLSKMQSNITLCTLILFETLALRKSFTVLTCLHTLIIFPVKLVYIALVFAVCMYAFVVTACTVNKNRYVIYSNFNRKTLK